MRGLSALNTSSLSFVPLQLHPTLLGSLESRFRLACQLAQMSPQARASLFCCVAQSRLYQIPVLRTLITEVCSRVWARHMSKGSPSRPKETARTKSGSIWGPNHTIVVDLHD